MEILIIEDDISTAMVVKKFLSADDHNITIVETAEKGQVLWRKHQYPLVLLDLHLSGMSGFQFCEWLRKQPGGQYTYVLVTTADRHPDTFEVVAAKGANDFLIKPHSPTSLSIRLACASAQIEELQFQKNEGNGGAVPSLYLNDYDTLPPHLTCVLNHPIKAFTHVKGSNTISGLGTCVIPIGSKIGINHSFDTNHTIITTLNAAGTPTELEVILPADNKSHKMGLRFVARNQDLDHAIGVPQTWIKKTRSWREPVQ
ncbi:MAG: response regulator [Verrucomicrobiota bacterium]